MKNVFFLLVGIVVILGSVFLYFDRQFDQSRTQEVVQSRLIFGSSFINVEIVETPEARNMGLSARDGLPEDSGMLFIFENPGLYGFWMKDMRFAIDIIWMDDNFEVVGVEKNVLPETFPKVFYPNRAVKYVLELAAGDSDKFGIDSGVRMYLER